MKEKLETYLGLLRKWQPRINLVAPSTLEDAWTRHFEDSLQLLPLIPGDAKILADLGSGAGFPGLVLGIALPGLDVHLIESDEKKAAFLKTVSRETGAGNVTVHAGRIEDKLPQIRADVVTARALTALPGLMVLARSQWDRPDPALLIFPKGADSQKEIDAARENYDFALEACPSKTAGNSLILCITALAAIRET